MNRWNILFVFRNLQPQILILLVVNLILLQSLLHVQRPLQSLPGVRSRVLIDRLISLHDFLDRFLTWNFQNIDVLSQNVHNLDFPSFQSQSSHTILTVFPPRLDYASLVEGTVRS